MFCMCLGGVGLVGGGGVEHARVILETIIDLFLFLALWNGDRGLYRYFVVCLFCPWYQAKIYFSGCISFDMQ